MKTITTYIILLFFSLSLVAQTAILEEGFESGTFPPTNWVTFRGVNDIGPNNDWTTNSRSNTGSSAAFSRYSEQHIGVAEDWLVTPLIDLTNTNNNQLQFYTKEFQGTRWESQYDIKVSTTSQTNHSDFTTIASYNNLPLNYTQLSVDLTAYDGQKIYIAFVHIDEYQDDWFLDDISVSEGKPNTAFITTWQTNFDNESITIPTFDSETYNYTIDWGDGTTTTDITGDATHTYTDSGTFNVSITGLFPRISFENASQENKDKIIDVKQWGNNPWTSMRYAFHGCANLIISATDAPDLSNVTDMSGMFELATTFNQSINHWDVGNVINMSSLFQSASSFNQPIDNWNTSNVKSTAQMFIEASNFNQSLNNWDVSNVTNMFAMFQSATSFNKPLQNWNVSKVTIMHSMFSNAITFNQPLNSWNVGNVTNIIGMFLNAAVFNQPLDKWNIGNVTNMSRMFANASAFNQPLDDWNISNVINMENIFTNSKLSTENYDATLQGWAALPSLQNEVTLDANSTNYCNSEAARNHLLNTYGWIINDAGLDCSTLSINNDSIQNISLYPNPALEHIRILNLQTKENYIIYDILGKKVKSGIFFRNSKILISNLQKGIYILKLKHSKPLRFVKQ